jgi:hypothetical protein
MLFLEFCKKFMFWTKFVFDVGRGVKKKNWETGTGTGKSGNRKTKELVPVEVAKKPKTRHLGSGSHFWHPIKIEKLEPDIYNNNLFKIIIIYIYIYIYIYIF